MPKKSNKKRSDGRFAVQVYLGMEKGVRKYKTVYGTTQKEANTKADEIKAMLNKGIDFVNSEKVFSFWVDQYLTTKETTSTNNQYADAKSKSKYVLNWNPSARAFDFDEKSKNAKKCLKNMKISEIRQYHLQGILDSLAQKNPNTHRPTAKKTLTDVKNLIFSIFEYAEYNAVITINPAKFLRVSPVAPKAERHALTKTEQKWIVEMPHRAQLPAMIMMYAGLRRGELTALLWSDVDLKAKTIRINKSYDFHNNTTKPPKTSAGVRVVSIPDTLVKFLKNQRRESIYVVCNKNGGQMSDVSWRNLLSSYICDLNLTYGTFKDKKPKHAPVKQTMAIEPFTWHCLRHTYATILYDAGVDVLTAKKLLGHSDVKTTLGIYTHLSAEKERSDVSKLNKFLNASQMQVKTSQEA